MAIVPGEQPKFIISEKRVSHCKLSKAPFMSRNIAMEYLVVWRS